MRLGAGTGGSDRVEITWANAITNTWLEVDVKANANTGLSADDVFYFASVIGNSGVGDTTALSKDDANDFTAANNNIIGVTTPVWNVMDYTKDGKVDINDANGEHEQRLYAALHRQPDRPVRADADPRPPAAAAVAACVRRLTRSRHESGAWLWLERRQGRVPDNRLTRLNVAINLAIPSVAARNSAELMGVAAEFLNVVDEQLLDVLVLGRRQHGGFRRP